LVGISLGRETHTQLLFTKIHGTNTKINKNKRLRNSFCCKKFGEQTSKLERDLHA
jgi:hypothetical protein